MNKTNENRKPFYYTTIPSNWEIKTLGTLGCFSKGKGITKKELSIVGFPCVRYGELYTTHNFIIREFISYIPEEVAQESKEIKNGDILFAGSGETIEEIGKSVAYTKTEKAYAGGDVIILSTNKTVDVECLSYFLETDLVRKQKRRLGQGNSVVHIYSSDLSKIKIPLPPLPEQKAIAKALSLMDTVINKNNQLIIQKEQQKKWLMQNLLLGKKRMQGFSGEWKTYAYQDVLKVVKRQITWNEGTVYNLISVRRRSCGIFLRESLYGHQIKVKDLRNVEEGDFLFSKMQIVHGASALVSKEFEGAKISGSYISTVVRDENIIEMLFFNYLTKMRRFYHQTLVSSYGVHIEKMTFDFKNFLKQKCQLPKKEEQTAIAKVLQAADKEIELLKAKTDKLREQKRGMMQVLLTGKKRLKFIN